MFNALIVYSFVLLWIDIHCIGKKFALVRILLLVINSEGTLDKLD